MTIYEIYKNALNLKSYKADEMEQRIEEMYACGKLSSAERVELLNLCDENASDYAQIDVMAKLTDLEARVANLESQGIVVWTAGHSTKKGETVLFDIDSDGTLDYVRYDGGRSYTTLRPGKIDGWVKLSGAGGEVTHRIEKDSEGNIILVPVNQEEEPTPEEPTEEPTE